MKIFIDAGHGGSDPGAVANGLREKDITLAIVLKMKRLLANNYRHLEVKFSRTTDKTVSLKQRTDMANAWKADYLLSIHINAGGGSGFESFIYNGKSSRINRTERLRSTIHDAIIKGVSLKDRGKKRANFHMLRESAMPAVLTENGFIDTVADANKLKSKAFIMSIAEAHIAGLVKAFVGPVNPTMHRIQKGDTFWSLARKYNTTVDRLSKVNPRMKQTNLKIGEQMKVK